MLFSCIKYFSVADKQISEFLLKVIRDLFAIPIRAYLYPGKIPPLLRLPRRTSICTYTEQFELDNSDIYLRTIISCPPKPFSELNQQRSGSSAGYQ